MHRVRGKSSWSRTVSWQLASYSWFFCGFFNFVVKFWSVQSNIHSTATSCCGDLGDQIYIYISRKQTRIDPSMDLNHAHQPNWMFKLASQELSRTVPWIAVGDWGSSDHIYIYIYTSADLCLYVLWHFLKEPDHEMHKSKVLSTDIYNSCVLRLVHECSSRISRMIQTREVVHEAVDYVDHLN